MRLPLTSDAADIVWCHHVLEQVPDDHQAMTELKRILKPRTGELILSAGISGNSATREFGKSDKSLSGNRRSYGLDLANRLSQAGFVVTQRSYGLTDDERTKYAIPNDHFYVCRKS